jgi:chromosomal replication initiator protein
MVTGNSSKLESYFDEYEKIEKNRFAMAACRIVVESPGMAYNPLVLYGHSGSGKKSLLRAIGKKLKENREKAKIIYMTAENLEIKITKAIAEQKIRQFEEKIENADLLLVDNLQFLSAEKTTQELFFRVFNKRHDLNRQIVIGCDRAPRLLSNLSNRLIARLEWGLIADIYAPGIQAKETIVRRRLE